MSSTHIHFLFLLMYFVFAHILLHFSLFVSHTLVSDIVVLLCETEAYLHC